MARVNSFTMELQLGIYSSLQNILGHYCFGSIKYFEEKAKNCENQNNYKGM
jgi:hypothetical protein